MRIRLLIATLALVALCPARAQRSPAGGRSSAGARSPATRGVGSPLPPQFVQANDGLQMNEAPAIQVNANAQISAGDAFTATEAVLQNMLTLSGADVLGLAEAGNNGNGSIAASDTIAIAEGSNNPNSSTILKPPAAAVINSSNDLGDVAFTVPFLETASDIAANGNKAKEYVAGGLSTASSLIATNASTIDAGQPWSGPALNNTGAEAARIGLTFPFPAALTTSGHIWNAGGYNGPATFAMLFKPTANVSLQFVADYSGNGAAFGGYINYPGYTNSYVLAGLKTSTGTVLPNIAIPFASPAPWMAIVEVWGTGPGGGVTVYTNVDVTGAFSTTMRVAAVSATADLNQSIGIKSGTAISVNGPYGSYTPPVTGTGKPNLQALWADFCLWERALSAASVQDWFNDPWQMLSTGAAANQNIASSDTFSTTDANAAPNETFTADDALLAVEANNNPQPSVTAKASSDTFTEADGQNNPGGLQGTLPAGWVATAPHVAWPATSLVAQAVHPRISFTPAEAVAMRAAVWNTGPPANPRWNDLMAQANFYKAKCDGNVANPGIVPGDTGGNGGNDVQPPTTNEAAMECFALLHQIDPDPTNRADWGNRAHTILMWLMNQEVNGYSVGVPFRDPQMMTYNRMRWYGDNYPQTIDWCYDTLSTSDKATIRRVLTLWCGTMMSTQTADPATPNPQGVYDSISLVSNTTGQTGKSKSRWAFNNYWVCRARTLAMMAICLDPADDVPTTNADLPSGLIGDLFNSVVRSWMYVRAYSETHDTAGGLSSEGTLYEVSDMGAMAQFFQVCAAAGLEDVSTFGPNVALGQTQFWRFDCANALCHQRSPGPIRQIAFISPNYVSMTYGDILTPYPGDTTAWYSYLANYFNRHGDTANRDLYRWFLLNTLKGGSGNLSNELKNTNTYGPHGAVDAFLALDPTLAAPADPRPGRPLDYASPGYGVIRSRTDWTANAAWFGFKASWSQELNHTDGDSGCIDYWRNSEFLLRPILNYDTETTCSDARNTLSIQNNPTTPALGTRPAINVAHGSQFFSGVQENIQGDATLVYSFPAGAAYAQTDMTGEYNTNSAGWRDVTHASRSVLWYKPDLIFEYSRATNATAGRFKREHWSVTSFGATNCTVATTAALPANTYNPGVNVFLPPSSTGGNVGATITANANGAIGSIDGYAVQVGDTILVKNEASNKNGLYDVTQLGDGSSPFILTRNQYCDENMAYHVEMQTSPWMPANGAVNGGKCFIVKAGSAGSGFFGPPASPFNYTYITDWSRQTDISGNVATSFTKAGQKLFITSLLPAGATLTATNGIFSGHYHDTNPASDFPPLITGVDGVNDNLNQNNGCRGQVVIQDLANPLTSHFLTVLQGADAGASRSVPTLISSTAGDTYKGALAGGCCVMFKDDITVAESTTTFSVTTAGTNAVYVTGLTPGSGYTVTITPSGGNTQYTVAAGGPSIADSGGVLKVL